MSLSILIADDSSIVRAMVKKSIAMSGAAVASIHEAANGKEALEVLARTRVDLVFADINMPVMSGTELVAKMHADPALTGIPVVVVSSERNVALTESLRGNGVRAFLTKPFRPEEFRDVVQGLGLEVRHG